MISRERAVETQYANMIGTLNLLFSIARPRPRLPPGEARDDGRVRHCPTSTSRRATSRSSTRGARDMLPFPKLPGSLYHCSKVHDSTNVHFACRTWGLRATDLNQGVVYGIETDETAGDERLITRFDYDEIFGTVLNRFCVQAVIGHPLTVYGSGGQTRGFLNIRDTLRCVELAVENPAERGRVPRLQPVHRAVLGAPARRAGQGGRRAPRLRGRRSSTARTPASRRKSTTTTRSTPSCSTSASSRRLLGEELVESMIQAIERHKEHVIAGLDRPPHPLEPGQIPCWPGIGPLVPSRVR